MATHGWSQDAPSGVYKNHKLSADIRMASIQQTKCMQFVKPEPGYGKKMGENVTITRVSNVTVPSSDVLVEGVRISEDQFSLSTQAITVSERGRAIPYTSLSLDLAHFDLENAIQKKLRQQLQLSLDITASAAFKTGQIKAIPAGTSTTTFDTDGTASTSATSNVNVYHIEQVRDYLFSTIYAEPYMDGDYVWLSATKGIRGIKRDPNWEKWHTYTDPEAKYNGEVGRLENCRFIEINHSSALSGSKGTGSVLGEGVCFGDDPVAMGVVQDPELRAKESEDYGRSKGVAWYGIYGFAQIWSDSATAGEARLVHITSS